jgi:outer membrane protein assembly factor BamB
MTARGLYVALVLSHVAAPARADDWPQLLGPRRNGVSEERGLNLNWSARPPRTLWKAPVGSAYSSLAVRGDRLVTTTKRGDRDIVVCLATADGKELWSFDAAPSYTDRQGHCKGPRSTPTIDGDRVHCLFGAGELVCLKVADGTLLWRTNILEVAKATPRGDQFYWGVSMSPLVEGDLVIAQPGGKDASVIALHRDTGKLVWAVGSDPAGYSSPIAIDAAGHRQIVCPTGKSILGVEPKTGELLWRYEFGNTFGATAATPVWTGELLFVSAAYGAGSAVLEIVADGMKVIAREKWKNKILQALMATAVISQDHVFGFHGDLGGFGLRCLDLHTGQQKWVERYPSRHAFIAAEGHLIAIGERGTLQLIEATPAKAVVKGEVADLLTYKAWAMPALANKRLYVRDETHVVCLDLAKE